MYIIQYGIMAWQTRYRCLSSVLYFQAINSGKQCAISIMRLHLRNQVASVKNKTAQRCYVVLSR